MVLLFWKSIISYLKKGLFQIKISGIKSHFKWPKDGFAYEVVMLQEIRFSFTIRFGNETKISLMIRYKCRWFVTKCIICFDSYDNKASKYTDEHGAFKEYLILELYEATYNKGKGEVLIVVSSGCVVDAVRNLQIITIQANKLQSLE